MAYTKKIKAGTVPVNTEEFIGTPGTIFYDPDVGDFYLSDGVTPGGTLLSSGSGGGGGGNGYTGSQGTNGYTGSQGDVGSAGATGASGTPGTTGYTGSAGADGTIGSAGATGPAGYTGSAGAAGPDGNIGATGTAGYTGSAGATGSNGTTGYTGSVGGNVDLGDWAFRNSTMYSLVGGEFNNSNTTQNATASVTIPSNSNDNPIVLTNTHGNVVVALGQTTTVMWQFSNIGTINTPSLLPRTFTAVLDNAHSNVGSAISGAPWQFVVAFVSGPGGVVETQINDPFPQLINPGYTSGDEYLFTEADHGMPGYEFTIMLNSVVQGGPGWTANPAVNTPPEYPSTVASLGAIRLSANTSNWQFDTDGNLTLPQTNMNASPAPASLPGITFTDGTFQTTAYTGVSNQITNTDGNSTWAVSVANTGVISMTTGRGGIEFGAMPEPGGPTHFHIMRPADENGSGGTDLYFGDDYNYVLQRPAAYGQAPGYGVEIGANDNNGGDQQVWRFGTDGTTFFPDGTNFGNINGAGTIGFAANPGSAFTIGTTGGSWQFGTAGNLTLPSGGTIDETGGIKLTPAGGTNATQALMIYPTAADGNHIHLAAAFGGNTELYLGTDSHYVKLVDGGNVEVRTSTANLSDTATWTFGTDGRLVNLDGLTLTAGGQFNICTIVNTGSGYNTGSALKATTGGSGTGMTVGIGYGLNNQLSNVTVVNPGTGYVDGDVITVSEGTGGTFTITQYNEQANQANNNFIESNWLFGTDGNLTMPGNLVIAGNTSVFGTNASLIQSTDDLRLLTLSSGANGAVSSVWVEDIGNVGTSNIAAVYANPTVGSKIVRIVVGQNGVGSGPNLWDFGTDGNLILPQTNMNSSPAPASLPGITWSDGTFQSTASIAGATGPQGSVGATGPTGLGFTIAKTYANVAALTADTSPTSITSGQFAIIDTGNVDDAENAKLYLWNGSAYNYVTDLSGSAGITGAAGATGVTGYTGSQGAIGAIGATGPQGNVGTTGASGPGFVWRGAWQSAPTTYIGGQDVVSYGGGSYIKIGDGNSGSYPPDDPVRWSPVAEAGSTGIQGNVGYTGSIGSFTGTTGSQINTSNTTTSTSTTTGALVVAGGAGIAGNVFVGGSVTATAATATVTSTAASVGYMGVPQNIQSGDYTLVIGDAGKQILMTGSGNLTIPPNSSVSFPIGTTFDILSYGGTTTKIAASSPDYIFVAGVGIAGGSRTLGGYGWATLIKVEPTAWFIRGEGLS